MTTITVDKVTGNITVDGKTITPSEVDLAARAVDNAVHTASNKANWSIKNVEKVLLYGAGVVSATNVFGITSLSPSVREWIVGGCAFVLAAIHVSTPKVG